jgi:hypothetical protein
VYSKNLEEHKKHLSLVLNLLQDNQLYAKWSKCEFAKQKVEYLGHIICGDGVATDSLKIEAMLNWHVPTNVTQQRGFVGLTGYYKRFIQNYGIICKPLFVALKKGGFIWEEEQQQAFVKLNSTLTQAPVLALHDHTIPFKLEADAYGYGVVMSMHASILVDSVGPPSAEVCRTSASFP